MNNKFAALVAALVVGTFALASTANAQPIVHVLKAKAVAPIRGTLVWAAYGSKVVVMDSRNQQAITTLDFLDTVFDLSRSGEFVAVTLPHGVEVWRVGFEGEFAGNPELVGGVAGLFIHSTIAGEFIVGTDPQDNIYVVEWRMGEVPTNPCPFKGGCPRENSIFLPLVARNWDRRCGMGGPDDPCAPTPPAGPTTDPGELPPTPENGPVVPTATPQSGGCGYPPYNTAEAAALWHSTR